MPRIARNIRLPQELWTALDQAALDASSRSGRYTSANAMLERLLRAQLAIAEAAVPGAADRSRASIDRVRAARDEKRARDRARVARLRQFIEAQAQWSERRVKASFAEAAHNIERWRSRQLAGPQYIDAWASLVAAGRSAILRALRSGVGSLSPEALAANSPFIVAAPVDNARARLREAS